MTDQDAADLFHAFRAELRAGRVIEAPALFSRTQHMAGACGDEHIYVKPSTAVVWILVHEMIHRRHPRWGEKRVRLETDRALKHMHTSDARRWYRAYQRSKRVHAPPVEIE